jgi:hypothetical protein
LLLRRTATGDELRVADVDRGIREAALGEVDGLKAASAEIGANHGGPELEWRRDLQVKIICHVLLVSEAANGNRRRRWSAGEYDTRLTRTILLA